MDWTPEKVAEILNRLTAVAGVAWDRGIRAPVEADGETFETLIVYGWITRDDVLREGAVQPGGYDFVRIEFVSWAEEVGFSTSSSRWTRQMHTALYGADAPHHDCVRVADTPVGPLLHRLAEWAA